MIEYMVFAVVLVGVVPVALGFVAGWMLDSSEAGQSTMTENDPGKRRPA